MTNLDSVLKIRDIAYKGPYSQSYGFSTSHVWTWKLEHKEGWVTKNWCFWIVMLEKTLESSLDRRRSNQSILKEISPEYSFIGETDVEAEAPIPWPPIAKTWLIGKDPDAGKDWRQEKGMTEDKMVGWHWLNGHEFEQAPGDGEGQGSLMCYSLWGHKESDVTEWLSNNRPLEHGLSSCGAWALLFCGMWDLPRSVIEPVSPALASRFFTTELPGLFWGTAN